jgi:copper chaperone CopZ
MFPMSAKHDHSHHESKNADDTTQAAEIPATASEETFFVSGMDCSEEVAAIEHALKPLSGVHGVRAEIVSSKVTVYHDGKLTRATLAAAINRSGVKVQEAGQSAARNSLPAALVAISGAATGLGIVLPWLSVTSRWATEPLFLIAIIAGGWLVVPKALRSLRTFTLDMNVLMVVAVTGAVAIGEQGHTGIAGPRAEGARLLASMAKPERGIPCRGWRRGFAGRGHCADRFQSRAQAPSRLQESHSIGRGRLRVPSSLRCGLEGS